MRHLFKQHRSLLIISLIVACSFVFVQCINNSDNDAESKEATAVAAQVRKMSFQQFAGSATCATCHKKIYESHLLTAHNHTSEPASEKSIKGSFEKGKNTFQFNDHLFVSMEQRDSGLYEVAYQRGIEKVARRFDIVTGSGAKGQTYVSWRNNQLFELPISYLTSANEWANSPGFPDKVIYNRPITSRCLECHSTYANVISAPGKEPEEYDHAQLIYGIQCERCHGPAAKHVAYETENPKDTVGKYIVKLAMLSRQQNLDLCGLCHGGRLQKTQPSFEFVAGDTLSNYFTASTAGPDSKTIDVHGNQFGMLKESKCFRMSATLTCNTCHDPHQNERGKVAIFSQRCMTCHNTEHGTFCKIDPATVSVSAIKANCVDCHMPRQPSMSIALLLQGDATPTAALIHTHLIKVYPEETKGFIEGRKKTSNK